MKQKLFLFIEFYFSISWFDDNLDDSVKQYLIKFCCQSCNAILKTIKKKEDDNDDDEEKKKGRE